MYAESQFKEFVIVGSAPTPEGDDVLEFRLLYQGLLHGGPHRLNHKHLLRREFHKQLKRLWATKSPLKERMEPYILAGSPNTINAARPEDAFTSFNKKLSERFSYHGYSFIPVVNKELFLTCSVEILLLRPEEESFFFEQGDIDGRIKIVLDSLRMPTVGEADSLKEKFPPSQDESPMYCLLEDDKLVSEVRITGDHLLLLPGATELHANEAFVVVHVKVKPTRLTFGNLDFA